MTDYQFDAYNGGATVRNPITNAGRVAGNARLDQRFFEEIQDASHANFLYPGADKSDEVFALKPREIALMFKTHSTHGSDGLMPVFSALNGLGHDKSSRHQVLENVAFAGLVGSDGAVYDSTGRRPANPDVALILGGTTTIQNTGKQHIANGDFIMWDLPSVGSDGTAPHNKRILASTVPYRPSEQGVTALRIIEHMQTARAPRDTPIGGAVQSLRTFSRTYAVMALKAFLDSGLVSFDDEAFGVTAAAQAKRLANAQTWAALGEREREKKLVRVARALHAANIKDLGHTAGIKTVTGEAGMSLPAYLDAMLIGMTPLVSPVEGSNLMPSGDEGMLYAGQMGLVEDLLSGMHQAQESMRSRVFARALTPAGPGKIMDINVAAYSV